MLLLIVDHVKILQELDALEQYDDRPLMFRLFEESTKQFGSAALEQEKLHSETSNQLQVKRSLTFYNKMMITRFITKISERNEVTNHIWKFSCTEELNTFILQKYD